MIQSAVVLGVTAIPVTVTVQIERGRSEFTIEGISEIAQDRTRTIVRTAIRAAMQNFPRGKVVVTVSPVCPAGAATAHLDLPIALAILGIELPGVLVAAALSLSGELGAIRGAVAMSELPCESMLLHPQYLVAGLIRRPVRAAVSLGDVIACVRGTRDWITEQFTGGVEVRGRWGAVAPSNAETALTDAIQAGHRRILLCGPACSRKTLLAMRAVYSLPEMAEEEAREVLRIHDVAEISPHRVVRMARPVRSPHHTISTSALIGGGMNYLAGEVTLAHHGVLILDDMHQFSDLVLQELWRVLDAGVSELVRGRVSTTLPARPALVIGVLNTNDVPRNNGGEVVRTVRDSLVNQFDFVIEVSKE